MHASDKVDPTNCFLNFIKGVGHFMQEAIFPNPRREQSCSDIVDKFKSLPSLEF